MQRFLNARDQLYYGRSIYRPVPVFFAVIRHVKNTKHRQPQKGRKHKNTKHSVFWTVGPGPGGVWRGVGGSGVGGQGSGGSGGGLRDGSGASAGPGVYEGSGRVRAIRAGGSGRGGSEAAPDQSE